MTHITIWEGYRATVGDYVTYISFDGECVGGVEYRVDDCDVSYTFYRAQNRIVVHETRSIEYGSLRAMYSHTQASVYIFDTLDEACATLNVPRQHIDPHRSNLAATRGNELNARTITLEQYVAEINYA
jgi:hypothetical protein